MAVDDSGYVYVTDSGNDRIEKFTADAAAAFGRVARDCAPLLAKVDKPTFIVASSYGGELPRKSHEDMQR